MRWTGRAHVPYGRPCAPSAGWRDRLSRADRPSGEGPRVPRRAGGDRGGAGQPPLRPGGGGGGAEGRPPGLGAGPGGRGAALVSHPSVREAVVVARGEGAERVLAGYVVPGEAVSPDELRPFLRAILPGHMVPASISLLDRLPLTSNGKVDRRALALRPPESRPEPAPPRSGLEETLAEIWGGLLGLERVGRDESFFDLGGHSLLLARLQTELRERLGREVPLLTLFQQPPGGAPAPGPTRGA